MIINIAYIIPSLDVGGSERKVIDIASGLNKDNFKLIIITITKNGSLASNAIDAGIEVFCANKKGKFDFKVIDRIAKILVENNIDIVQVYTSTGKLWGRLAAKKANVKVVISTEESLFRNKFIDRYFERKLVKNTDLIITNSEATLNSACNATGIDYTMYKIIYNGIDLEPFLKAERKNIISKDKDEKIIMCVARLDPRKNIDMLITAFNFVSQDVKSKLVIIGSGSEEQKLKKQVTDYNLDEKVIFLGSRNDVPSLLKEADLFVLPSTEEGFGNVIIEAIASGVCVAASNVGGIPEIITNEDSGFIFDPKEPMELIRVMLLLLNDDKLRAKLAKNAFKTIMYFSKTRMIKEHEDVYIDLLESR